MTHRRNWTELVNHYRVMLIYIAVVVTLGLALQTWEAVHGN